jgi:integrase
MMGTARKRRVVEWSHTAGEKGVNRVRVFDRGQKGIYIEWWAQGEESGGRRRQRQALGPVSREEAKATADEVAAKLRRSEQVKPKILTLVMLFDMYVREKTPLKSKTAQAHDRRCMEMFLRVLGAHRDPHTLSVREWNSFISERRAGRVGPKGAKPGTAVRARPVQQDLRFLLAVLNWATLRRDEKGRPLLEYNPLKGLPVPREESPKRTLITLEQYGKLRSVAAMMAPWLECLVVLAYETGHRGGSLRQLRWSDVDFDGQRVHWRGEADKIGFDHFTPLREEALAVLRREQSRTQRIGDAWVFPSAQDASRPRSEHALGNAFKLLATKAGLPGGTRMGWHSFRRRFATDLKERSLREVMALGGWKSSATVLMVYQQPEEAVQRSMLEDRPKLSASGN